MNRRGFVAGLGGLLAAAGPAVLRAQQPGRMKRVGVLMPYPERDVTARGQVSALTERLQKLGWIPGQNVQIVAVWTEDLANLQAKAKELVAQNPDLIVVRSTAATRALQRESSTIPIVFTIVSDPVGDGFVASLARPSGNITGFTNVEASLGGKWLEVIREIAVATTRVATVYGPQTSASGGRYYDQLIRTAARAAGIEAVAMPINDSSEVAGAFAAFAAIPNGALIVTPDATTTAHRQAIFGAASQSRLPAIYSFPSFVREGGLASYGVDQTDLFLRTAIYADRILRGASPAELPVQGPVKFELCVNTKTASALGLTVPPTLLARADEVIE